MEATVEQKLRSLFNLQLIDSKIDKLKSVRGELPIEVSDLEDEIAGLGTRIENLTLELSTMQKSIDDRKKFIKDSTALISKYEGQQTNVKNNREFLALTKEVEMQKLEIMAAEKKIKDFQYQIQDKKENLDQTNSYLDDRSKDLQQKKDELDNITSETDKEEGTLNEFREDAAQYIDDRLLKAYNRVRLNVKNRLGVVTIDRDACAGCFSKVPPQRQLDIRQRKKIIVCENCGRILIDSDLAVEVQTGLEKTIGTDVIV